MDASGFCVTRVHIPCDQHCTHLHEEDEGVGDTGRHAGGGPGKAVVPVAGGLDSVLRDQGKPLQRRRVTQCHGVGEGGYGGGD